VRWRERIDDSGDGDTDVNVSDRGIKAWIYRQSGQHVARFDRVHVLTSNPFSRRRSQIAEPIPPLAPVTRASRVAIDILFASTFVVFGISVPGSIPRRSIRLWTLTSGG
jgi:hypothetical protein